jgi:uncharacterized protein YdaU (DUF1376 family)
MPARDRGRPFWSKWVWKDWDAKTKDLDPYEYTAYHRLLSFAATSSPDLCSIPDDDRRIARALGWGLKRWRSVRVRVLEYFVLRDDGRYQHPRLAEDAVRWSELVARGQRRVNRLGPLMDHHRPQRVQARASNSGVVVTESVEAEESESRNGVGVSELDQAELPGIGEETSRQWREGFDGLYEAYPRKRDRAEALKAYLKIRPRTQQTYDAIWAGLDWWKREEWAERQPDKVEYLSTWLNKRRWLDAQAAEH